MMPMKKRTTAVVTMGVWMAAFGSAAALAYTLNSPLRAPALLSQLVPSATAPADVVQSASRVAAVISVPMVTIVGRPPRAITPKPAPEISKMHCADWRALDVGSGRVQVCE
jgi:hypothetical protein